MSRLSASLLQIIRIGLSWLLVCASFWVSFGLAIAWLDPDSMDPGDAAGMVMILGSMGILTGIVFGMLMSVKAPGPASDPRWRRSSPAGFLRRRSFRCRTSAMVTPVWWPISLWRSCSAGSEASFRRSGRALGRIALVEPAPSVGGMTAAKFSFFG